MRDMPCPNASATGKDSSPSSFAPAINAIRNRIITRTMTSVVVRPFLFIIFLHEFVDFFP